MNPTGTMTHAARRAAAAQQPLVAAPRAELSEAVLRSALEHLTEPVFLFEPLLDGDHIVDLLLLETNPAGRAATRAPCSPGVLASELFVAPALAMTAAQRAWDGLPDEQYEIARPGADDAAHDSVYRITTLRAGGYVMQVVHDRTSEHDLAAAEERFRLTADLLAQPLHLHRPIFDDDGALVDTEIIFANRVAEVMDNVGMSHVGHRASEIIRDPTGAGLQLYRAAWNDPDGLVHRMTFDNLDHRWPDRPFAYLEVQARRVGDMVATVAVDRTETEVATRQATAVSDQLAAMFDTMSEGVLVIAPDGRFLAANQAAASMAGLASSHDLVGLQYGDLELEVFAADGAPVERRDRRRVVENGQMLDGLMGLLRRPDGTTIRLVFTSRAFRLADGRQGTLLTASDVSRLYESLAETARTEDQFRIAMEAMTDPVLLLEGEGTDVVVVYANSAAAALGGEALSTSRGVPLLELELDLSLANTLILPVPVRETITLPGRSPHTFEAAVDEAGGRRVAVFHDVTLERAEAALLEHLTRHDPVSGLPNRRGLDVHLAEVMATLEVERRSIAVIVVDVDQVAEVQRTFGYAMADQLVTAVVQRLRAAVDTDVPRAPGATPTFVAQLSGSSFAVVVDAAERVSTLAFAANVVHLLSRPVVVDGIGLHVEASAGVVFAPLHGHDYETLVMRAKAAAWGASRRHVAVYVWQPEVDRDRIDRVKLLADVDRALGEDELYVEYQPKVELASGAVVGAEALVRWAHPTLGHLAPSRFIAEVEESALAARFTRWVLRRALREWVELDPAPGTRLAVNLPPSLAGDPGLAAMVEEALVSSGATPDMLELEITERGLLTPGDGALANMATLTALGVHFVIDDFGTGQASLGYLRHLPVQAVKIDQSFVHHLESDVVNRAIVEACVGVAAALGIDVVAEGLELESEVIAAIDLGCGYGQGFRIARPMAIEVLAGELAPGGRLAWR